MTTAPPTLVTLQANLVKYLHTVNLGIVGDMKHVSTGGYHIGAQDLRSHGQGGDYSLQLAKDKVSHNYSCAIDIGGTPAQLMTLGTKLYDALVAKDGRVYGRIRGFNGPWHGQSIDRRFDSARGNSVTASSDRNHIHIEFYRAMILDQNVMTGLYSVLSGGGQPSNPAQPSKPAEPAPPVVAPTPPPIPEDDMANVPQDEWENAYQRISFIATPGQYKTIVDEQGAVYAQGASGWAHVSAEMYPLLLSGGWYAPSSGQKVSNQVRDFLFKLDGAPTALADAQAAEAVAAAAPTV